MGSFESGGERGGAGERRPRAGDSVDCIRSCAIIAAAQRVEHYEIAGYGTVRTFAEQMGHTDAAALLQKTLDEEGAADKKLSTIAMLRVNQEAARPQ